MRKIAKLINTAERWILLELQVLNSPFNQEQVELLNRVLPTLTDTQRIWLSGYLTAQQGSARDKFCGQLLLLPCQRLWLVNRSFLKKLQYFSDHKQVIPMD